MTAARSRKQVVKDTKHLRKNDKSRRPCPFCAALKKNDRIIQATKHFIIIENLYPYSLWDSQKVEKHLLIVPKKHTDKLGELGSGAGEEYLNLIDKYESQGFNLYARAPSSVMKTVEHQHSHLIKPYGKVRKFVFFLRKPYIRWHA